MSEALGSVGGGFASGLAPYLRQMYAQQLMNAARTPGAAPAAGGVDPGNAANVSSTGAAIPSIPYTGPNYAPPPSARGGLPAAAWGSPMPTPMPQPYAPPIAPAVPPPAPVAPQAQRPLPIPPIPPTAGAPTMYPGGSQGLSWAPTPPRLNLPMPSGLNAGDVGSGSLVYQPGAMGFGAFGNITSAPGAAQNFQNQFGFGQPGTRQTPNKYFTERWGNPRVRIVGQ